MALNNSGLPAKSEISIKEKIAVCRCWQSKKFPFCDGSHHGFNAENSDNIGPLIINKDD